MKRILRNVFAMVIFLGLSSLLLTSCVENHYYHRYHHHSRGWYDHRHQSYPPGVDFNVDVR
jgi:hypothetical protein